MLNCVKNVKRLNYILFMNFVIRFTSGSSTISKYGKFGKLNYKQR